MGGPTSLELLMSPESVRRALFKDLAGRGYILDDDILIGETRTVSTVDVEHDVSRRGYRIVVGGLDGPGNRWELGLPCGDMDFGDCARFTHGAFRGVINNLVGKLIQAGYA